jgi:hypothetical protein
VTKWKYFGEDAMQRYIGVGDTLGWLIEQQMKADSAYKHELLEGDDPALLKALVIRKQMCKELVELFIAEHDIK